MSSRKLIFLILRRIWSERPADYFFKTSFIQESIASQSKNIPTKAHILPRPSAQPKDRPLGMKILSLKPGVVDAIVPETAPPKRAHPELAKVAPHFEKQKMVDPPNENVLAVARLMQRGRQIQHSEHLDSPPPVHELEIPPPVEEPERRRLAPPPWASREPAILPPRHIGGNNATRPTLFGHKRKRDEAVLQTLEALDQHQHITEERNYYKATNNRGAVAPPPSKRSKIFPIIDESIHVQHDEESDDDISEEILVTHFMDQRPASTRPAPPAAAPVPPNVAKPKIASSGTRKMVNQLLKPRSVPAQRNRAYPNGYEDDADEDDGMVDVDDIFPPQPQPVLQRPKQRPEAPAPYTKENFGDGTFSKYLNVLHLF
jgi:hypothetical protein